MKIFFSDNNSYREHLLLFSMSFLSTFTLYMVMSRLMSFSSSFYFYRNFMLLNGTVVLYFVFFYYNNKMKIIYSKDEKFVRDVLTYCPEYLKQIMDKFN